jgi:hypothetical protein
MQPTMSAITSRDITGNRQEVQIQVVGDDTVSHQVITFRPSRCPKILPIAQPGRYALVANSTPLLLPLASHMNNLLQNSSRMAE